VRIQIEVFSSVTQCSVVVGYQSIKGPCCLHLFTLTMEEARTSETLVSTTTLHGVTHIATTSST